jgi:hypothetical protein
VSHIENRPTDHHQELSANSPQWGDPSTNYEVSDKASNVFALNKLKKKKPKRAKVASGLIEVLNASDPCDECIQISQEGPYTLVQ